MEISIKADMKAVIKQINGLQKSTPSIIAKSLTNAANSARADLYAEMRDKIDRPTPFIVPSFSDRYSNIRGSLFVTPADKKKIPMVAIVGLKDLGMGGVPNVERMLRPHFQGGNRVVKRFERALQRAGILSSDQVTAPARGLTLDKYGNVSGAILTKMLSDLQANPDAMQNATTSKRSKAKRKKTGVFFVMRFKGKAIGIWKRTGINIEPFLNFISMPSYKSKMNLEGTISKSVKQNFRIEFEKSYREKFLGSSK